ncbi:NADH:ubiquinone reductase (Na(+)-transporting) subunit C [Bacteroidales bacterium OttesenSCG-928-I21]|nr:NADH:ubiquinone reductase (Na(+)-transporting) subunit C [Bacteroidales bacterium OttesenSCG-928-I21]
MNTNSNAYTIIYASIMVIIVAFLLAFTSGALKERQDTNVELDKKKQILSSLNIDTKGQDAAALYEKYIKQDIIINSQGQQVADKGGFNVDVKVENGKNLDQRQLPVFIADIDGKTKYILPVRGAGLWGPIWGYVALDADKNTIYGTYFSHEGETPGLGAEISTEKFQREFVGKRILNASNRFVSVAVKKAGQLADGQDQVDALSGGTITSNGVSDMLRNSLGQYEKYYESK